jgi:predicted nucleotidyltransferase
MRNKLGLLDDDVEAIVAILSKQSNIEKAYIFGSRAKGNFKNGSDVDIALKGNQVDFDTVSQVSYWLNEETSMPYKFDVLNYHTITEPDLKDHIDRVGIELYSQWEQYNVAELIKKKHSFHR